MQSPALLHWQQSLVARLERALDRKLVDADLDCIAWNVDAESLTVESRPLLGELRSHNVISNVFRGRQTNRPV